MGGGGALTTPTVVVVDNDAPVRAALSALLKSAGYAVDTFASAESFLESDRLSSTGCLLLDVRMSGMGGLELQEHLARLDAQIPIIFMTAYAESSLRSRSLAIGKAEFLEKPFTDEALLGAIERMLRAAPR